MAGGLFPDEFPDPYKNTPAIWILVGMFAIGVGEVFTVGEFNLTANLTSAGISICILLIALYLLQVGVARIVMYNELTRADSFRLKEAYRQPAARVLFEKIINRTDVVFWRPQVMWMNQDKLQNVCRNLLAEATIMELRRQLRVALGHEIQGQA